MVIVCGSGNNGGDGFVTARYALSEGADVAVLVMGDASHMGENSLLYKNIAAKMGIPVISVAGADDAKEYLAGADIIVDALIGTGLKHHVKESTAELITAMNDSEAVIVSVDVPSGMFSDSGCAAGAVVNADYTVALGSVKRGHVLYREMDMQEPSCIHPSASQTAPGTFFCKAGGRKDIYEFLPVRSFAAHKGTNGFIGIFAGSEGMAGAGLLAAQGALYGGGGKIALASVGNAAFQLAGKFRK
ncbi:MAG: NAD(P)H-hydrate epimerase [Dialister invisus]